MPRHFLGQNDLDAEEMLAIFASATRLKQHKYSRDLQGQTLVMFFEKASTRTRLSFEIGMTQLGGHAVYLDRESSQLSRGESVADTARVVSRYADLAMARVYQHRTLVDLAAHSTIPVINGLSDEEHPCQSMADAFSILESKGRIARLRIAYVGDGQNNVTHSLMLAAAILGAELQVAAPPSLQPERRYVDVATGLADLSGGSVDIGDDPRAAVEDADVVYTDVWVSMGREDERQARLELLRPYQVNAELLTRAAPDYLFMHCLPAHAGEEVTGDVLYGDRSIVFEQAENRLHVQKALMLFLLDPNHGGK